MDDVVVADGGLEPEDLAAVVRDLIEEELERYFDVLLPARIDADFRGNGYEMLWRMMDAHDRRELERPGVPASPRARAMAARVRAACPPVISERVVVEGGQLVLGRYTQITWTIGTAIRSSRGVEIYPRALLRCGAQDGAALRAEIALTIFHEYIHYFESFLLRREQPLAGRERGERVLAIDLADAQRLDRRHTRKRIAFWVAVVAIVVAVVAGVVFAQPHDHPPEHHQITAAEREQAQRAVERQRAEDAAADRALLAHIDEIVARDLDPQAAVALVGGKPTIAFAPGHEDPMLASSQLVADPALPGVPATVPGAAITYLWLYDRDSYPPRLIGIAWSATTGHAIRVAATTK